MLLAYLLNFAALGAHFFGPIGFPCQDVWKESCPDYKKKHTNFCDLDGPWVYITLQCVATCELCGKSISNSSSSDSFVAHSDDAALTKQHVYECTDDASVSCADKIRHDDDFCKPDGSLSLYAKQHCAKSCGLCIFDVEKHDNSSVEKIIRTIDKVAETSEASSSNFSFVINDALLETQTDTQDDCNPPCKVRYKCLAENCVRQPRCMAATKYGKGPPNICEPLNDPQNRTRSGIETWFTKEIFYDLFPKANLGWGPHVCWPYSYEAFIIAARYFPRFGTEAPDNGYSPRENFRRDLSAFFAHAIQETGENNADIYKQYFRRKQRAHDCFYRGGFYNWFEGGPTSPFLPKSTPGHSPADSQHCVAAGKYCNMRQDTQHFYPCSNETEGKYFKGCYFGRGAIQLSYNYNYGAFQKWLISQSILLHVTGKIKGDWGLLGAIHSSFSFFAMDCTQCRAETSNVKTFFCYTKLFPCRQSDSPCAAFTARSRCNPQYPVTCSPYPTKFMGTLRDLCAQGITSIDLLHEPWKLMTHRSPPLSIMASLWFYMTPQPPKPAMHDIIIGNWKAGDQNLKAGFSGPIFGPTSLIINNECGGEDLADPGGPGESRRIKAFKWFTDYFGVPAGKPDTLSCKGMPEAFEQIAHNMSWQPDWSTTWKEAPCKCAPATYGGIIPYYQKEFYPQEFVNLNAQNAKLCEETMYKKPQLYRMNPITSSCLNYGMYSKNDSILYDEYYY